VIRKARAIWRGTGRDGSGNLSPHSGVLAESPYSFRTRFKDEKGTNPEELVAAAHAGCFTMAVAFGLRAAGTTPTCSELIGRNIRVNAVSPGVIETPLFSKLGRSEADAQELGKTLLQQIPVKRFDKSEEVATAVAFLASVDELAVDSGRTRL
jgi:NAD(P)-dependent dehydrogenase (short-subunit alcohol dehydrogenase family)